MKSATHLFANAIFAALLVMFLPAAGANGTSRVPSGAGQSSAPPAADITFRENMLIVGSSGLQEKLTPLVLDEMYSSYKLAPATVMPTGTAAGFKQFCGGVGTDYPDIVAATRKIRKGEIKTCWQNGVRQIIEIKIGLEAFMVVTRRGDPVFNVTPRMFYLALAKDLPSSEHFEINTNTSWKSIDPQAPDVAISVILPNEESGSRGVFDDYFLQAGCRHYPGISDIYSADLRVPRCITLRGKPQVIEIPEPYFDNLMGAFAKAPSGTLAVVGELEYLRYQDQLEYLPVEGVLPTRKNVSNFEYSMIAFPRYYVKRAHMRNNRGEGVVRGLREFMRIISSEKFVGPAGIFDNNGLTSLDDDEREDVRKTVRRLKSIKR